MRTALVIVTLALAGCATHSNPECRRGVAYSADEYAALALICLFQGASR